MQSGGMAYNEYSIPGPLIDRPATGGKGIKRPFNLRQKCLVVQKQLIISYCREDFQFHPKWFNFKEVDVLADPRLDHS